MYLREMWAVAAMAGHAAAHRICMDNLRVYDDPNFWPSFGLPLDPPYRGNPSGEAQIEDLAQYVCSYHDEVGGEQLFRKAAELGIHKADADGWAGLEVHERLAYQLFAVTARACFKAVRAEVPVEFEVKPATAAEPAPVGTAATGHESKEGQADPSSFHANGVAAEPAATPPMTADTATAT